ncbi:oxidoreductase UcpA [Aspergillus ellipticus CBS 707.79]|uniref:Oxidoreductase UcpA n=1 Tax=Aspergillus ellipticus CBS 707.79 TaxID=1448320 RepID=A0A319DH54_9EURO|nr:oxidoreductase UcpA [Aspergillus ellipticus CBS 707.79]
MIELHGVAFITGGLGVHQVRAQCNTQSHLLITVILFQWQWLTSQPGIGKTTAYTLTKHGVRRLAIADINFSAAQEIAKDIESQFEGTQAIPLSLDVTNPNSIHEAITETVTRFGRIDYAINSAGVSGPSGVSHAFDIDAWHKTLDVNLHGVWMCSREEIQVMLKQEKMGDSPRSNRGVIVNLASVYGLVGSSRNLPVVAYPTSKHAVVGFTKSDAVMYAPQGIRINALCPGYVTTPMTDPIPLAITQKEEAKIPLGRMAFVEEIADAIAFLVSPMSSYMYESAMVVDGGFLA